MKNDEVLTIDSDDFHVLRLQTVEYSNLLSLIITAKNSADWMTVNLSLDEVIKLRDTLTTFITDQTEPPIVDDSWPADICWDCGAYRPNCDLPCPNCEHE